MEKSLVILALAICVSFTAADDKLVNWISDNDTLPEMLPKQMIGKSNEEIQKAVFSAYKTQMEVISEYSGHVYDPEFPYGYLNDEYSVPHTETFQANTEFTFTNNIFKGLASYHENVIVFKWAPDQIATEIKWIDAALKGNYVYSNATFYEEGKYHINLKNVKYLAKTTLSGNTMIYPASVPKSSISYETAKVSFTKTLPEVNDVNNSPNIKYFLEDVAFQHLADDIAKTVHNNITIAVRQAIKPYIIFKNVSDPHFKGFSDSFPTGVQYRVDGIFTDGLNQTFLNVKDVFVDMATKNVSAETEFVLHKLSGDFTVLLDENKPSSRSAKAQFTIGRIDIISVGNMLDGADCFSRTSVVDTVVDISKELGLAPEFNEIVAKKYAETLTNKFNTQVCLALSKMLDPQAGSF